MLGLAVPPVAIAFRSDAPPRIERLERAMPPATADGRTGAVAANSPPVLVLKSILLILVVKIVLQLMHRSKASVAIPRSITSSVGT
jgi:hypothetical protein